MNRFAHARGVRRLGALLLLLVLLPGWTLPPECAACPHGAESDATAPEHIAAEHTASEHVAGEYVAPEHTAGEAHALHEDSPAHHEGDCGCPCDVQCAAVQIAVPATIEVPSGDTPDAPTIRVTPTRIRPASPPFPPHFLPLSNAPPR